MKRIVILVVLLMTVPALRAQKKEIKKAHQEVKAGNLVSAASYLLQAKRIFAAADNKTRAEYYVVEAELQLAEKQLDVKQIELISQSINKANKYELSSSLLVRISEINLKINSFSASIAGREFEKKNYSDAAILYKKSYESTQDTIHLLKAARSHLLAKEYDDAYKSYNNLINMGYTNAKTQYVATHVATNKKVGFSSIEKRNKAIADGLYKNPEVMTSQSKLPEILRGITVASISLDKKNAAVAIIDRTLAKMPENKMLLKQVSQLYLQLDAYDKYNAVLEQLIKETPNDPNLYYNSAVTSAQNNDLDRAKKYYKKALEMDPNYINAKINLSILLLEQDKVINNEMNELGASISDDTRYKELKLKRNNLYDEVIPYLESIVKSQPQNKDFAKKLKHIYSFKGETTKMALLEEN